MKILSLTGLSVCNRNYPRMCIISFARLTVRFNENPSVQRPFFWALKIWGPQLTEKAPDYRDKLVTHPDPLMCAKFMDCVLTAWIFVLLFVRLLLRLLLVAIENGLGDLEWVVALIFQFPLFSAINDRFAPWRLLVCDGRLEIVTNDTDDKCEGKDQRRSVGSGCCNQYRPHPEEWDTNRERV